MLIAAVLPPLTRELGFPDWTAGAIFSVSALAWSVTSPYWGRKSSEWGRRKVAAIGMFGFAASMGLFAVVATIARSGAFGHWVVAFVLLLLARSLFGTFGSGTNPAAQAYVADRTTPDERTDEIAALTSGFTIGTALGPAVAAALIVSLGLMSPVWIISILAAGVGVLVLKTLPEEKAPRDERIQSEGQVALWRDPGVMPYLIYAVGLSLVSGILVQTFPYAMMDKMGVSGIEASQYIAAATTIGAGATLMAQLVFIPRLKLPVRDLMVWGAILLIMNALGMLWTTTFAVFCLLQMLIGFGQGLCRPGFTSGASLAAGPEMQGSVAGLVTAANGAGFIVSPFFGLWMYENVDEHAPFIFAAVVLAMMGVYAYFKASREKPLPRGAMVAQAAAQAKSGEDDISGG